MRCYLRAIGLLIGFLACAASAAATETTAYTYDANGRLIQVTKAGTVNNGVLVTYQHDKADNRTQKQTTGASNPGVVVLPLPGFPIIPTGPAK